MIHFSTLLVLPSLLALLARGPLCGEGKKSGGWQNECNLSCCLEGTCERSHLSLLVPLLGTAAGDDTEDASTEFTDSIEEEAAHNSHQQVRPSQALGSRGGGLRALRGLVVFCSLHGPGVRSSLCA